MDVLERGTVKGGVVVPDRPLDLPEGTPVEIRIAEPAAADASPDATAPAAGALRDEPFIGMWADREDMKDSVAWVNEQRARWMDRLDRDE